MGLIWLAENYQYMTEPPLLMIPGPVPTSEQMRSALAKKMINHRGNEFKGIFKECQELLQEFFGTANDVVIVSGSGTASMEMAVSNVVGPNDTAVCLHNGSFGERFDEITRGFTSNVHSVSMGWGEPFGLSRVESVIDESVDVVTMVHAETSVGLVNPVEAVSEIVRDSGALFVVDCITSVGCEPVQVDNWGVDLGVTASQKAIGAPPGLSAITVSDQAERAIKNDVSSYYLNLASHLDRASDCQTPTTCSVPLYQALREGLTQIASQGLDASIARHARFAAAIREGLGALGLEPFPSVNEESSFTNGVVVSNVPDDLTANEIVSGLEERGVIIKTGIGPVTEDVIRIGTMGAISEKDVLRTVRELGAVLETLGHNGNTDPEAIAREHLA